jgi:hypothetical protein
LSLQKCIAVAAGLSLALVAPRATAATLTHTTLPDFQTGISDGVAQAMIETFSGTPAAGAVGIVPKPGTVVFNDDFNQTTVSSASADYLFRAMNEAEVPNLVTNPSEFLFSGDTPTTVGGTAPPAGFLRLRASRPADLWNTGIEGQRSPVLAINRTVLTGDFIAETKLIIQNPRSSNNYRHDGLFIGVPVIGGDNKASDFVLDDTSDYLAAGTFSNGATDMYATTTRMYGGYPTEFSGGSHPGETCYVRVVKRGSYFYVYMKSGETEPWVFQQWVKYPALAQAPGLVVGVFAKSFSGATPTYQDDDFDYLKVTRIASVSGSFTNVFDAGAEVNWQRVAMTTTSKQGTRYQLRAGNALSGGTLTDAGNFVGPDGTSATFFTDEAAQVPPNAAGKRYLEYKLVLDEAAVPLANDIVAPNNLPASVRSITATYQPSGVAATIKSTAEDFGAVSGGIEVQPGGGDLSLARTEVFRDDFSTPYDFGTMGGDGIFSNTPNGWLLHAGYTVIDPTVVGDYSTTERPGYFRMKVGWPQDFYGGILAGGVKLLRDLPPSVDPGNFEIETEVNVENEQCRMATLLMWMDENNWVGIGVARRFENTYDIGIVEDMVLNAVGQGPALANYGSNTIQLRVSKQGTWVTIAYRDPASNSPSWRVLVSRNTAGAATGGADFVPTKVGLLGKSYGKGDRYVGTPDFNYFRVANLAASGQTDLGLTLPAATRPDAVIAFGDRLTGTNAKAQIKNSAGVYVGPDGTSATYFTVNEPRIPESLAGVTSSGIRLLAGDSPATGVPYLHAIGVQYATGDTRIAHDSNAADFAAGAGDNISVATPGIVANGGGIGPGPSQIETFDYTDNDLSTKPWEWSNTPSGNSSYSLTENPGYARIFVGFPEDLWGPGSATQKPRICFYKDAPVTGDWEIEMTLDMPMGRDVNRHYGIGVIRVRPEGNDANTRLDLENCLIYGPYHTDGIRFMNAVNNGFSDWGPGGYIDTYVHLRLRKLGSTFTGYFRANAADPWIETGTATNANLEKAYIGFLGKSWWYANMNPMPADIEEFKFTPLTTGGAFQSRVLDLGVTGLSPRVATMGGNSAGAQVQWRAADTTGALASAPFVGPDGTVNTYFAGDYTGVLPAAFEGKRYFQYRVLLPVGTQINDISIVGLAASTSLTTQDAVNALRIAGGLQMATAADMTRLDVVKDGSAGAIQILDAAWIIRSVAK